MRVVILQDKVHIAQALARLLAQEIPSLEGQQIKLLPDDRINTASSVLNFLEQNKNTLKVVILDAHLRLNPSETASVRAGLNLYRRIVEEEIDDLAIITISFEPLRHLTADTEFACYFRPEWLDYNPFIQYPVIRSELGSLVNHYLSRRDEE